jgi:S-adenosylhomocysteine hydrolase
MKERKRDMKKNYIVTNFGEFANIIDGGKLLDRDRQEVFEGTVTTELYRFGNGLYSIVKLNEEVVFCNRLA